MDFSMKKKIEVSQQVRNNKENQGNSSIDFLMRQASISKASVIFVSILIFSFEVSSQVSVRYQKFHLM